MAHDTARPLSGARDREAQIVRVCERLVRLLPADASRDARPASDGARAAPPPTGSGAELLVAGERRGELHGVPPLPPAFVAREELVGLLAAVLRTEEGAVGVTGKALGLRGQGGIGKTVLAAAMAHDDALRRHFPDGVFWVTVGERDDLVAAQIDLLARLGAPQPDLRSATQGQQLLRDALAQCRCLLVVDNVWSLAAATAFRATGRHGRVLYTTRDPTVLRGVGAGVAPVGVLPDGAARQLLACLTATPEAALPAEAEHVLEATGRVALALALVGAAVGRGGRGWQEVAYQVQGTVRSPILALEAAANPVPAGMAEWRRHTSGPFRWSAIPGRHDTLLAAETSGSVARTSARSRPARWPTPDGKRSMKLRYDDVPVIGRVWPTRATPCSGASWLWSTLSG